MSKSRRALLCAAGAIAAALGVGPAASALPADRTYEVVSPLAKNSHDVRRTFSTLRAADTDDRVTYTAFGSFPVETPAAAWMSRYIAARSDSAWSSRSVDSKQVPNFIAQASLASMYQNVQSPESFDRELTVGTEQNYEVQLDPNAPTQPYAVYLYRRDYTDDSYRMLEPSDAPMLPVYLTGLPEFVDATPDRSRIVFETTQNLTSETSDFNSKLYEWHDGEIHLVGLLPDSEGGGAAQGGSFGATGPAVQNMTRAQVRGRASVMSIDGSRIYFATGDSDALYVREDGGTPQARTVRVSASEHTSPAATPQPVTFGAASADGGTAVFTTAEQLVDEDEDAAADLYRFDLEAPEGSRLTLVSTDGEDSDGTAAGALGVVGASSDLSRVYFAASGQIVDGAPTGPGPKLYLYDDGEIRHVATLSAAEGTYNDPQGWEDLNWMAPRELAPKTSRVSADGRYLLFRSRQQLTSYDNADFDSFYLFDAEAASGSGIACVSCRPTGEPPSGHATIGYHDKVTLYTPYQPRLLTEYAGGARVFFDSYDSIVPQDENGRRDVYVYDTAVGEPELVSSGKDAHDSNFMDADPEGEDAYFVTRERLSGWDRDELYDVYDARVGPGLPEPSPAAECQGDGCQGGPAAAPLLRRPITPDVEEPATRSPSLTIERLTPAQVRALARGARVRMRLRATVPGRITVRGTARLGKRVRTVIRGVGRNRRAGATTVRLRLTRPALSTLRRKGRLAVRLRVHLEGSARPRTSRLVLTSGRRGTAR